MPIDAYSLCPGGSGKKVKFCCPELLGDLQELGRMVQGQQYLASLKRIEDLEKEHPGRACLWAIKLQLLQTLQRMEEARAAADAFLAAHPENPVALAESAMVTAATEGGPAAMKQLLRAVVVGGDRIYGRVYAAIGIVAQGLLAVGEVRAARALLSLQVMIDRDDQHPLRILVQLNRSPAVPLLVRDDSPLADCPEDVAWKTRFEKAMKLAAQGNWTASAESLRRLSEEVDDSPAIWQNLAIIRGWIADTPGSVEALRKFAGLDVSLEDAVEAETLAMLLVDDPLGDELDAVSLTYTGVDTELILAGLAAHRQAMQVPGDPPATGNEVPPKAVYSLLSCHAPETADELTLDTIPRVMGLAMLFGRQTDREARLKVIGLTSQYLERTKALLREIGGDGLAGEPVKEPVARISASRQLLQHSWWLPRDMDQQQLESFVAQQQRKVLLEDWPRLALGVFDGKSALQVAGEEGCRVKLLAVVMLLAGWSEQAGDEFDFNQLRSLLGLPVLETIDPRKTPLDDLPLVRLSRVMVEELSDEALLGGYRRALSFDAAAAIVRFGRALVERPAFDGSDEQQQALTVLVRIERDSDRALECIERGRRAAESSGKSSASWDMLELSLRLERGEAQEAARLVDHLQSQHIREPGVAAGLTDLLIQIGAINPDGSPAVAAQEDSPLAVPEPAPAQGGELWTPDSQKPSGEKPTIWTPGMG